MNAMISVVTADNKKVTFIPSGSGKSFTRDGGEGECRYVLVRTTVEKVTLGQHICFVLDPMVDEKAGMTTSSVGFVNAAIGVVGSYEIKFQANVTDENSVQGTVCLLKLFE